MTQVLTPEKQLDLLRARALDNLRSLKNHVILRLIAIIISLGIYFIPLLLQGDIEYNWSVFSTTIGTIIPSSQALVLKREIETLLNEPDKIQKAYNSIIGQMIVSVNPVEKSKLAIQFQQDFLGNYTIQGENINRIQIGVEDDQEQE